MNVASIDQLGNEIIVPKGLLRIVSLVPSQTELLFDLGLEEEVVGVTRFCIHPEEKVSQKAIIGGTKNFDMELIHELSPNLIIGNKEENYQDGVNELRKRYPVWMSDIYNLHDAYSMMSGIGAITGRQKEAEMLIQELKSGFSQLATINSPRPATCAYFIWRKPYMVAAQGTFIEHMIGILGMKNVFGTLERYPELSAGDIADARPDVIFLSSEPYAFRDKHIAEFKQICPNARVEIVDGELFSWYGSRLRHTAAYFAALRESIGLH